MSIISSFKTILSPNNPDNYPDAVIEIDGINNIISWNRKAEGIFGRTKNEMEGRNIALVLDVEEEKLSSIAKTGDTLVIASKNGADKDIFVEISCAGIGEKILITARDVTKKQKIIEKLVLEYEKVSRIGLNKNAFILNLSNDIKTPVHSLLGFSQGLLDGVCGELNEKQLRYASIMHKNASGLLDLLDDFFELSLIESEEETTDMRVFNLMSCVNGVCDKARAKAERKGLRFDTDFSDPVRKNVYSDDSYLTKTLTIVLDNAINFSETGVIKLKISHPEADFIRSSGLEINSSNSNKSYIVFSVMDSGAGIAKDDIQGIFDEYSPANRNIAKKYGGTGLRLALAGKMVARLGGVIFADSEVGQGSVFSFIIPIERSSQIVIEKTEPEPVVAEPEAV